MLRASLYIETEGVLYAIFVADFARPSDSVHFIENGQIVVAGDVVELDLLVERQQNVIDVFLFKRMKCYRRSNYKFSKTELKKRTLNKP